VVATYAVVERTHIYLSYIAIMVQLGWSVNCTISQRIRCVIDGDA